MIKKHIQLGSRPEEIRPVGAWVLPEECTNYATFDAVKQAREEEERIFKLNEAKNAKIKAFQAEVRKRVRLLESMRQLHLLDKSALALQTEQKVITQSADKHVPRKNCCTLRNEQHFAIQHSTNDKLKEAVGKENNGHSLHGHTIQVQGYNQSARRNLVSKKIATEDFWDNVLPGGIWKEGKTLDHPVSRRTHANTNINISNELPAHFESCCQETAAELVTQENGVTVVRHSPDQPLTRSDVITQKSATVITGDQVIRAPSAPSAAYSVHAAYMAPNLQPGVISLQEQKLTASQRATYRRFFMDIEREQVKENIRQREHRNRIHRLKKEKELERELVERQTNAPLVNMYSTGDATTCEEFSQEYEENVRLKQYLTEQQLKKQKAKEIKRYLDALRRTLRDKMEREGKELPQLCVCGPTVWDTNPDTCANNCIFYKNPQAYAQALQTLLASHNV